MLKLKLQYFGHLMWRVDSLEKTLMLGGIGGRRRRVWQRMRWLDGITDSMDVSLSELGSWWWTGRPGVLWFLWSKRVGHDWATELNWTEDASPCGKVFLASAPPKAAGVWTRRLLNSLWPSRCAVKRYQGVGRIGSPSPPAFDLSRSFPMSQYFASGAQSIGASASASVLPMNIQDLFPLDWLVWSPLSTRDSQESSPTL